MRNQTILSFQDQTHVFHSLFLLGIEESELRDMDVTNTHLLPQNMCQCHGWNKVRNLVKFIWSWLEDKIKQYKHTHAQNPPVPPTPLKTPISFWSHLVVLFWFYWNILLYSLLQQFQPFVLNSFWKNIWIFLDYWIVKCWFGFGFFLLLFICSYKAKSHLSVPLWSETQSFESRLCPPGVNYLYNNSLNYLKPCLSECFDVPKLFWINRTLLSLDISDIFGDAYGMISPDLILYNLVLKWISSVNCIVSILA